MTTNGPGTQGPSGLHEGGADYGRPPSSRSDSQLDSAARLSERMNSLYLDLEDPQSLRRVSPSNVSPFNSTARLHPSGASSTRLDASGNPLRLDTTPEALNDPRQGADYLSSRPQQPREMRSPASASSVVSPLDSASTISSARMLGQASELHTKILALQRTRSRHVPTNERRRFSSTSSTSSQPRPQFSLSSGFSGDPSSNGSQPSSTRTSVSASDSDAVNPEGVLDTDDEAMSPFDEPFDQMERFLRSERTERPIFGERWPDRAQNSSSPAIPAMGPASVPSAAAPASASASAAAHAAAALTLSASSASLNSPKTLTPVADSQPLQQEPPLPASPKPKFDPSTVISPTAASIASSGSGVALSRERSFRTQQRASLSERRGRGMRLDMSSGPASPAMTARGADRGPPGNLRSMRGGIIPPPTQSRGFSQFSDIVDKEHGCLKFDGKARVHAHGIEFSTGEKFDMSIDKIEYISELGAGNYGTVNKVLHRPNNVLMAVKEIRLELEDASLRQIIMELDVLHRCGMENIIAFYGAFFSEGSVYICMEYMDGGSINKIYEGGIPEKYMRYIVRDVVRGLRYLKEKFNIIHRDVKPTNILCSTDGLVKMCDFGVSGNLVMSIARTNIGCQPYMAPERIKVDHLTAPMQPNEYTVESDIWSLGLSIIEMSQGKYPYPPETYANIFSQLSAIVEDDAPALDPTKYSPEACDFVARLLNKSPAKRPRYAQILKHPWLQVDDCTPEELGAFVKERLARGEQASRDGMDQPTAVGAPSAALS